MFQLWKKSGKPEVEVGPLETELLELLWNSGEKNVNAVLELMNNRLAYTTVMTTLDRLYKKGILKRRMHDRAYYYQHRFTREEWVARSTDSFVSGLLANGNASPDLLASCLVEAVGNQDVALLDELEAKIRAKRRALKSKEHGR